MSGNKTLITGGHVITMDPALGDLAGGAVLIEDDHILTVTRDAAELDTVDAERIDATGGYVLPGMIDSHRHTWLALLRGISGDQSLLEFLATTFYGIGAKMTAEDLATACRVGALEALDAGVTTIFDCCDCVNTPEHAEANVEALRASGIRSVYAYGMQRYDYEPPAFTAHAQRLADAARLRGHLFAAADDMSRMGILYSDFGTVPFDATAAEIRLARELGVFGASHTGAATTSILLRGLRELHDHGLLLPGHLHVHVNGLNAQEWQLLADSGAVVTTSPETELQMGMGMLPLRPALDHGMAPGVGTDSIICGSGDLFSAMRLGLQHQRCMDAAPVHAGGTMPLTVDLGVRDALTWATHNGAHIVGMDNRLGALTSGYKADVIVVKPRWNLVRSSYPAASVVLQSTAADVDTVLVNGIVRKRDGRLTGVDLDALRKQADTTLDRIETAAATLPVYSTADLRDWYGQAERTATAYYARAYPDALTAQV
ncbi:amidohydrolase family protein [Nocardia nova SH22a]|uniref:Amidohydrolase family protein n=1 Tax=Nocardia nova SH22a TaxID=1415166 RepID=W5TNP3_9NOCA|nr:amidohydrolase family protein [Nocardia nova]AHH20980.1 amidohydrolase family protein [Nocardia nova SH22a]